MLGVRESNGVGYYLVGASLAARTTARVCWGALAARTAARSIVIGCSKTARFRGMCGEGKEEQTRNKGTARVLERVLKCRVLNVKKHEERLITHSRGQWPDCRAKGKCSGYEPLS